MTFCTAVTDLLSIWRIHLQSQKSKEKRGAFLFPWAWGWISSPARRLRRLGFPVCQSESIDSSSDDVFSNPQVNLYYDFPRNFYCTISYDLYPINWWERLQWFMWGFSGACKLGAGCWVQRIYYLGLANWTIFDTDADLSICYSMAFAMHNAFLLNRLGRLPNASLTLTRASQRPHRPFPPIIYFQINITVMV